MCCPYYTVEEVKERKKKIWVVHFITECCEYVYDGFKMCS